MGEVSDIPISQPGDKNSISPEMLEVLRLQNSKKGVKKTSRQPRSKISRTKSSKKKPNEPIENSDNNSITDPGTTYQGIAQSQALGPILKLNSPTLNAKNG